LDADENNAKIEGIYLSKISLYIKYLGHCEARAFNRRTSRHLPEAMKRCRPSLHLSAA